MSARVEFRQTLSLQNSLRVVDGCLFHGEEGQVAVGNWAHLHFAHPVLLNFTQSIKKKKTSPQKSMNKLSEKEIQWRFLVYIRKY